MAASNGYVAKLTCTHLSRTGSVNHFACMKIFQAFLSTVNTTDIVSTIVEVSPKMVLVDVENAKLFYRFLSSFSTMISI